MSIFGEKIKFIIPDKDTFNDIKVVGVGGGGSNTVNYMYAQKVPNVDFAVCNTDRQALESSPVRQKVQLGSSTTEGLGAGSRPQKGAEAARESMDAIKSLFPDETKMVFITAGMGGGTGTGAGPIIARTAREMGKLTLGIVTMPFDFERRNEVAEAGLKEMREAVDALIVISNQKILDIYGKNDISLGFSKADDVLFSVASNIADVINRTLTVNVDLNDMRTLLKDSGTAMLGAGRASGENMAKEVIEQVFSSPLLSDLDIYDSKGFIFVIKYGKNSFKAEVLDEITKSIRQRVGDRPQAIKWGYGQDPSLGENEINLVFMTAGFPEIAPSKPQSFAHAQHQRQEKKIKPIDLPLKGITPIPLTSHLAKKQMRTTGQGEQTEYNVYTLNVNSDDMPRIVFGRTLAQKDSFSVKTLNERTDDSGVELSPMDYSVEEVFASLSTGMHITPRGRDKMLPSTIKNTEPAYIRLGVNIFLNPDKENRTNTFHV